MSRQIIPKITFDTESSVTNIYTFVCLFHFLQQFLMNMNCVRPIDIS